MDVILRNGKEGKVRFDDKLQSAFVDTEGRTYLVAYMRDNKVKVKNDIILNEADLSAVRAQMLRYVKKVDAKANKKRK